MHKKYFSISILLFLILAGNIFAQDADKAREYENKAYEFFTDENYEKAAEYYLLAAQTELESNEPNLDFVGKDYEYAASMKEYQKQYSEAIKHYFLARKYFKQSGNWEYIKQNIRYIADCFQRIRINDGSFKSDIRCTEKGYVYFSVDSILKESNDTSWVIIDGGTNDLIYPKSSGEVISIYSSDDAERGNIILGKLHQISSGLNTSTCYVVHSNKDDPRFRARIDDLAALPVRFPASKWFLVLSNLSKLDIEFLNLDNNYIYVSREMLFINDTSLQNDIFRLMAEDVRETVEILQDYVDDYPSWSEPLEGGKYDGISMLDAMEKTTSYDISAFLNFVSSYPGKYMGIAWKINETYATWLINATPLADFDQTLFEKLLDDVEDDQLKKYVTANSYYITDTIFQRMDGLYNDLYAEENFDSAVILINRFIRIADWLNNNTYKSRFLVSKANLSLNTENWNEGIEILNKAIAADSSNLNTWFYRGYAYGQLEDYHNAVQDYKMITQYNPSLSVGYGNQGWYLLLDGKIFDALKTCKKAYELDSFQVSSAVNLGHAYMLLGDTATAGYYYDRTLELISTPTEFITGPIADFDIFIKNDWQTHLAKASKHYMLKKYNNIYKYRILSDSIENISREHESNKEYHEALDKMLKSYDYELQSKKPRPDQLYVITSWIGYLYQQVKDFENAENYYNKCLHYAHDVLRSDAKTANVYDLFSWLYDVWGKKADYLACKEKQETFQRKADEAGKKRKLYLLAVGNNNYKDVSYNYAHRDAEELISTLTDNASNYYDSVSANVITNKDLTLDRFEKAFRNVIFNSRPDDIFVFYLGGTGSLDTNEFRLTIPKNDSTDKTVSIDVNTVKTWLSTVQARNQFIMLDIFAPSFVDEFVGNYAISRGALSGSNLNLGILSLSGHRIEDDSLKHGALTHAVIELLKNGSGSPLSEDKYLSIKDLNAHMFTRKNNNENILTINTYFTGNDFILISYDSINIADKQKSGASQRSRGVGILNGDLDDESEYTGTSTNYALLFATNEYDEWDDLVNPVIDAKALANTLQDDYGFEVELLTNNKRLDILTKVREYQKKQYHPNDQLFIFFAGHGSFDEISGEGYIVCKDSRKDDEIRASYIPYSYLRENVNNIRNCRHILIALDVCFGGTFDKQVTRFSRGSGTYDEISKEAFIKRAMQFRSRLFITSGSKEYVSDGDPGKHSPFAYNILDVLRSQSMINGYATFNMLVQAVERLQTTPRYGDFGDNEPGSEFIFNVQVEQPQRAFKVDNLKK